MGEKKFTESARVSTNQEQLSSDLGGETVILDLKSGEYFGLNPVGARVWQSAQEGLTVGQIRDRLVEEFEVEHQQCTEDLSALLESMLDAGLITLSEGVLQN